MQEQSETTLVVVPCGKAKVWDKYPDAGPTPACEAYIGSPFKVNSTYAERFGDRWVILSAKYGFVDPGYVIEGPYDVTFKDRRTNPIGIAALRRQVDADHLRSFQVILGLGGRDYRQVLEAAFDPTRVVFPFSGLQLGYALGAAKHAIAAGVAVPTG